MYKNIQKTVGQIVSEHRKKRALSQESLAEIVDLHRTYIGSVERGERNISLINLNKICSALDLPLSAFFKEVEEWDQKFQN